MNSLLYVSVVVICFKFSNFAYANTVHVEISATDFMLLFALNLVTLLMQIQSHSYNIHTFGSCYLL